ncbi:N-acetylmuramoyl-L-alanine amidase [Peribacillus sp. TH16]|nr:N-acetylmuramoyl-L-alanine amidase [Peribacillus sp. TH16]
MLPYPNSQILLVYLQHYSRYCKTKFCGLNLVTIVNEKKLAKTIQNEFKKQTNLKDHGTKREISRLFNQAATLVELGFFTNPQSNLEEKLIVTTGGDWVKKTLKFDLNFYNHEKALNGKLFKAFFVRRRAYPFLYMSSKLHYN